MLIKLKRNYNYNNNNKFFVNKNINYNIDKEKKFFFFFINKIWYNKIDYNIKFRYGSNECKNFLLKLKNEYKFNNIKFINKKNLNNIFYLLKNKSFYIQMKKKIYKNFFLKYLNKYLYFWKIFYKKKIKYEIQFLNELEIKLINEYYKYYKYYKLIKNSGKFLFKDLKIMTNIIAYFCKINNYIRYNYKWYLKFKMLLLLYFISKFPKIQYKNFLFLNKRDKKIDFFFRKILYKYFLIYINKLYKLFLRRNILKIKRLNRINIKKNIRSKHIFFFNNFKKWLSINYKNLLIDKFNLVKLKKKLYIFISKIFILIKIFSFLLQILLFRKLKLLYIYKIFNNIMQILFNKKKKIKNLNKNFKYNFYKNFFKFEKKKKNKFFFLFKKILKLYSKYQYKFTFYLRLYMLYMLRFFFIMDKLFYYSNQIVFNIWFRYIYISISSNDKNKIKFLINGFIYYKNLINFYFDESFFVLEYIYIFYNNYYKQERFLRIGIDVESFYLFPKFINLCIYYNTLYYYNFSYNIINVFDKLLDRFFDFYFRTYKVNYMKNFIRRKDFFIMSKYMKLIKIKELVKKNYFKNKKFFNYLNKKNFKFNFFKNKKIKFFNYLRDLDFKEKTYKNKRKYVWDKRLKTFVTSYVKNFELYFSKKRVNIINNKLDFEKKDTLIIKNNNFLKQIKTEKNINKFFGGNWNVKIVDEFKKYAIQSNKILELRCVSNVKNDLIVKSIRKKFFIENNEKDEVKIKNNLDAFFSLFYNSVDVKIEKFPINFFLMNYKKKIYYNKIYNISFKQFKKFKQFKQYKYTRYRYINYILSDTDISNSDTNVFNDNLIYR